MKKNQETESKTWFISPRETKTPKGKKKLVRTRISTNPC